jgi:hypothetical protein
MRLMRLISWMVALLFLVSASACASPAAPDAPAAPTAAATSVPATPLLPVTGGKPTSEATVDFEKLEDFDPANFDDPTNIDNPWFSQKPGTRWVYEGVTEEAGLSIPHRVIFTVTDMTKVIDGVRTVIIWDQDYSDGELVETELAFFAQDNEGNVWRMGEYPEVYENGKLVDTPAWISGLKGASAGIMMKADPQLEASSYSQGWGPAVNWTDRGQVADIDHSTCVPQGCYEGVLVIEEFSREEPDAFQLKHYARDVGNIYVGWKGADATKETLELVELIQLSQEEMMDVRAVVLEMEQRAYENSKEVYDQTPPLEGG